MKLEFEPLGKWGRLYEAFIKERRSVTYVTLLLSCKLDSYLEDIQSQAAEMLEQLVMKMAKNEGITEQLKAENQLEWVRCINSGIVLKRLLYQN